MEHAQCPEQRAEGLCLDHPGCGLSAQVSSMLVKYSSGREEMLFIGIQMEDQVALVFGSEHTGRLCCSSQQASLLFAGCALVVGVNVVGVHASQ